MELMGPKMLAETADMIGVKELRDAFKEVHTLTYTHTHTTVLTAVALSAFYRCAVRLQWRWANQRHRTERGHEKADGRTVESQGYRRYTS